MSEIEQLVTAVVAFLDTDAGVGADASAHVRGEGTAPAGRDSRDS
jgi:hypothetical protein